MTHYQSLVQSLLSAELLAIVHVIIEQGGRALLVGGSVRDLLLKLPVKDIDIEVHNLSLENLASLLRNFGIVDAVGKSFGVLRIQGLDVDWSLPRTDSSGRKPQVAIDPYMSIQDAFRRRDLTINAMGIDLATYELIDPFHGQQDLQRGILRATDPALFVEDPLRFYRVMQFVGRFAMQPDNELNTLCASMDLRDISRERIEVEFEKLLLRSARPSLGICWLQTVHRLQEILPEVYALIGVQQDPVWHPEGDVFEHTMQALDVAAVHKEHVRWSLAYMWAVLCHDLGKVTTTKFFKGRWHSYGHDVVGADIAKKMLKRITHNADLITTVSVLVRYHMRPLVFSKQHAGAPAYKRLAFNLMPYATIQMLCAVAYADRLGRKPPSGAINEAEQLQGLALFEANAKKYGVYDGVEKPLLQGKDFLDVVQPGPELGKLVKKAYELQIEKGIDDPVLLKKMVLNNI